MKTLKNHEDIDLMNWETRPNLRNKNNEISFLAPKNTEVGVGDRIESYGMTNEKVSYYEILNIKEIRQSSFATKNYITATIKWYQNENL